jgi:hypothetical protein
MLVEFTRARATDEFNDEGETPTVRPVEPIAINPVHVSAVLGNRADGTQCIIRLADGRGFMVQGDYPTVMTALRNGGLQS